MPAGPAVPLALTVSEGLAHERIVLRPLPHEDFERVALQKAPDGLPESAQHHGLGGKAEQAALN
jgi:hypothetical protein